MASKFKGGGKAEEALYLIYSPVTSLGVSFYAPNNGAADILKCKYVLGSRMHDSS